VTALAVVADNDDPTEVVWGVEALLRTLEDPAEPPLGPHW